MTEGLILLFFAALVVPVQYFPPMKTLILSHDDCLLHDNGVKIAESPARVKAVLAATTDVPGTEHLPAPLASDEQILRVHDPEYWTGLIENEPEEGRVTLDWDTFMSKGSLDATRRGSGAACFAVDQILDGKAKNAFCATRPPGHHSYQQVAMGFCLSNHVAIAARHAQQIHGLERIAILDFDVHHGNGTQEIFEDSPEVLFISSHQFPLYPGTGTRDETGVGNIVNIPLAPGTDSDGFRKAWAARGFSALFSFDPELILVSAGFDAHESDPLAQLMLKEDDFAWITREVRAFADEACDGRLISVLEGGYDLDGLAASARAHVEALAHCA
jgi:acetoin utilization deacetylase AcuC-like enzyme